VNARPIDLTNPSRWPLAEGRDLNWYAKPDTPATQFRCDVTAEEKLELKKQNKMRSSSYGFPVPQRVVHECEPNSLGESQQAEAKKARRRLPRMRVTLVTGNLVRYGGYSGQLGAADDREAVAKWRWLEKRTTKWQERGERGRHGPARANK